MMLRCYWSRVHQNPALWLVSWDFENGSWVDYQLVQTPGLLADVWYDVRMTIDGNTVTGEYKEASSNVWLSAGTVTTYDDFDDAYVGIRADRGGWVDEVGYVPEPLTLTLLTVGGMLLRRRRAL